MGKWPTADPWLHTKLSLLFDENSEGGGQKRSCQLRVVFRIKCLRTLPRDHMCLEGCNIFLF